MVHCRLAGDGSITGAPPSFEPQNNRQLTRPSEGGVGHLVHPPNMCSVGRELRGQQRHSSRCTNATVPR